MLECVLDEGIDHGDSLPGAVFSAEEFGQLYEMHRRMVYNECFKVSGRVHDAEDMTNDVFIHAWNMMHQLRDRNAFSGWIRSIAHRMTLNYVRRTRKHGGLTFISPDSDDEYERDELMDIVPVDRDLLTEERDALLAASMGALTEMDRGALHVAYYEGDSFKKDMIRRLCERDNIPEGTAKRRIHVARKRMRKLLERNGINTAD